MDKVFVVWKSYHEPDIIPRGYWDQGLLEDTFNSINELEFVHTTDFNDVPDDNGAVVIINGRTHVEDTEYINISIERLNWVLFIETGDEEATFPWREIKHPLMRVWLMLPRMNVHDDTHFKLPQGYRPETHETLKAIGSIDKKFDWFFAGQVNHERREQCAQEIKYLIDSGENPNGNFAPTDRFGEEKLPYKNYLEYMAASKVVFCPSGIETPDNFRLYEALEAGCIPIVDAFSTKNKSPGFWRYVFGDDIPFPIVDYWDAIPKMLPELLKDWRPRANRCFAWWQLYKRKLRYQLVDDIKELSR